MNHVQLIAHEDTQVLFHKAALQPVSPQPVLVYVPGAGLHLFASVELHEVTAGALLQLVEVPVNGSIYSIILMISSHLVSSADLVSLHSTLSPGSLMKALDSIGLTINWWRMS